MVTFTNRHHAPGALYRLLGRETYSRGDSVKSVSQLINPPRIDILKREHDAHLEVDISDRIWSLLGSAVHKLIEDGSPLSDGEPEIVEQRIFTEVEGWRISGAIDRQVVDPRRKTVKLIDWKLTRTWSVTGGEKREWLNQLNFYAYLVETETDFAVDSLEVCAILRDWSRREAERDPHYPQSPIHVVPIPLWDYEERRRYVLDRVKLHQQAEMEHAIGVDMPECSDDEMWRIPPKWEVRRDGAKRASRVFSDEDMANEYAARSSDYIVNRVDGRRVRCEICEVARYCSQNHRLSLSETS